MDRLLYTLFEIIIIIIIIIKDLNNDKSYPF